MYNAWLKAKGDPTVERKETDRGIRLCLQPVSSLRAFNTRIRFAEMATKRDPPTEANMDGALGPGGGRTTFVWLWSFQRSGGGKPVSGGGKPVGRWEAS